MDFRSKTERLRDSRATETEQKDYKRAFEEVRQENAALHGKLDEITRNHGELQAQFSDLLTQFGALKSQNQKHVEELLAIAKNMEGMVSDAYQKQGDLMDRFRADISARLTSAKSAIESGQ